MERRTRFVVTNWQQTSQPTIARCPYGQQFWTWYEAHYQRLCAVLPQDAQDALDQVDVALYLLQETFAEHLLAAPVEHRVQATHDGHQCIFGAWFAAYTQIKDRRKMLQKPVPRMRSEPAPVVPPPLPQAAGIWLPDDETEVIEDVPPRSGTSTGDAPDGDEGVGEE